MEPEGPSRSYPLPIGDTFREVIDGYRCTAMFDSRRCQLYAGHDAAHAHASLHTGHGRRVKGRYVFDVTAMRWNDAGESWPHDRRTRLPWACMFSD